MRIKGLGLFAILAAILAIAYVFSGSMGAPAVQLRIASGSENKSLEPIIQEWAGRNNVQVTVTYLGSVDISREIGKGTDAAFDAVWPAHSIWIELGDSHKVVSQRSSIMRSPIVLGLRRSIAAQLGWIGRDDITIQMISAAAKAGSFRLAMTSATQSNSGASAYIGFLYALAGNPDVLSLANLADPAVQGGVRDLLAQVDRSSGSSGWLKDALVTNPEAYDAMFNYESLVLEADQALVSAGQEPLYIIYPSNGLSVADSPLGLIDRGDTAVETAFLALQAYLLTAEVQDQITATGRRAGLIGLSAAASTAPIWNADWGVDLTRNIASVPTPDADVIREALRLYQTELRKPSLTIWVLDVSGSMDGAPLQQLKDAMTLLLDPEAASLNLLQPSDRDITIILPFSSVPMPSVTVTGGTPADLAQALRMVRGLQAGGGTDLYAALGAAFELLKPYDRNGTLQDYLPAIVAMTDGASDTGNRDGLLANIARLRFGRDVPVHAVSFGDADVTQLDELNAATIGRLFDGNADLAEALRSAKGYN